jgi:hypothetical protein
VINRKAREDRLLEEELNFPFYIPSTQETIDRETYFCALRVAIKQLDLTKRALAYDIRARQEVSHAIAGIEKALNIIQVGLYDLSQTVYSIHELPAPGNAAVPDSLFAVLLYQPVQ